LVYSLDDKVRYFYLRGFVYNSADVPSFCIGALVKGPQP
jgi:hypothetical protein